MAFDRSVIVDVTAADDPRVADYMNLKDAWLRHQRGEDPGGKFMAEGRTVVAQLLRSPFAVASGLFAPERLETMIGSGELDAWPADAPIYRGPIGLLREIVGFAMHRGVLAAGRRGIEPGPDSVLDRVRTLVVLEDLANHDNVGGIFRSVAGLAGLGDADGRGGGGVLLNARSCDPLYRKALRVSMGCALRVPWARAEPWPAALDHVRGAGWCVLALSPDPGSVSIDEARALIKDRPVALLAGAEGPGLTHEAMAAAEATVRVPIDSRVDSLNVGVATAIALAGLCRPVSAPGSPPAG